MFCVTVHASWTEGPDHKMSKPLQVCDYMNLSYNNLPQFA